MFSSRSNWPLVPNRFSTALEKHRAAGRELLDLTASNPTNIGLRYEDEAILSSLHNPQALRYLPDARGLRVARDAVAAYYRERRVNLDPDRFILTTSTSEAYSFVFRLLCDPADEVLVPAPSYPLFQFLADIQDVHLRTYPLFYDHGWHLDLHALTPAITERTRAIMVVHPNNPTGSYLKPAEAVELNVICSARGLALVADEVFLDFAINPVAPPLSLLGLARQGGEVPSTDNRKPKTETAVAPPLSRLPLSRQGGEVPSTDNRRPKTENPVAPPLSLLGLERQGGEVPKALTFTLSGLSKIAGLPQMKFAWIAVSGPEDLARDAMARLEVIADTYLSMNAPIQLAAPVLFAQRHEFQRQLMERIRANLTELDRQLQSPVAPVAPPPVAPPLSRPGVGRDRVGNFCERLEIEGGWYAVVRVPATRSDEDLAIELLEKTSVLVHPGHFYDFPADGYLVVSLIAREEDFREGIKRLLGEFEI